MTDFTSGVLVTDRRRTGRRRGASDHKSGIPAVARSNAAELAEVTSEQTIAERREIMDRRRQDRRRQIDPTTCERDYSDPEIEFMRAMDDYKRKSGRPFPTWSEVLEVVTSLGYRKVADPSTLEWRTFGEHMGSL
jgi:hypothetical protein